MTSIQPGKNVGRVPSSWRSWLIAARPHTLPAVLAPILVGFGIAGGDGVFSWSIATAVLLVGLSVQIAANFANDVSDALRDADPTDRTGPARMVSQGHISPQRMWFGVWAMLIVAGLGGGYLWYRAGWLVPVIGILSVLAMLGYVGGPLPYGYRGWGEVSVFVFFGLVATVGTRFVFDQQLSSVAWWLAVPMGMMASAILVVNNLRDIETDRRVGKRTLAVKLGARRTVQLYIGLLWLSLLWVMIGIPVVALSPWTLSVLFLAPASVRLSLWVSSAQEGRSFNRLLFRTALLQLVFGTIQGLTAWLG